MSMIDKPQQPARRIVTGDEPAPPEVPFQLDFVVGEKMLVRTVTHYYVGRVRAVNERVVALEDAAWIADTGRYDEFLRTGQPSEYAAYPEDQIPRIARDVIVDYSNWPHPLLRGK